MKTPRTRAAVVSVFTIVALWAIYILIPTSNLQAFRFVIEGRAFPIYYVVMVLPVIVATGLAASEKCQWSLWEIFWWTWPLACLPGIGASRDPIWAVRQWMSWLLRGPLPGGVLLIAGLTRKRQMSLARAIYGVAVAASLVGIVELSFHYNPFWDRNRYVIPIARVEGIHGGLYRPFETLSLSAPPRGTQGNRIPYAAILVGFLPLGLWSSRYGAKWKLLQLAAVVAILSVLLLSEVRSAWAGTALALVGVTIAAFKRDRRRGALGVAALAACLAVFLVWPHTREMLLFRLGSFRWNEPSIKERLQVLQTLRGLSGHLLFGVGFGQFPTACLPYYHGTAPWTGTPDNEYFRWTIENGIASSTVLLLFCASFVATGWRKLSKLTDLKDREFYESLLIGWAAIAFTFVFFDGFYWGACDMTFWCLLGLFGACLSDGGTV